MKKILLAFVTIVTLYGFGLNEAKAEGVFGQLRNIVQEQRQIRQETRIENKERWKGNVLDKHAARLKNRFNFYYQKLSNIIKRLEAKELNDQAKAKLAEAKTKLEETKKIADEAVSLFENATNQEEAKTAKDKANQARQGFVDTTKLLVETVRLQKQSE